MRVCEKDKREVWLIALLFSFTFFVFGPLELYMTNVEDSSFYFSISNIVGVCLLCMFLSVVALVFVQTMGKKIVSAIVFAIGVALYIQGNYINPNYGAMNGMEIDWTIYRSYSWKNSFFWVGIIIISIFITIKFNSDLVKRIQKYISIFIICIEIVTLSTLTIVNHEEIFTSETDVYISDDEQFVVGTEKNIILILLDTFDSAVFEEIMEEDSNVKDNFENFTYYKNMTGGYPFTAFSVPLILTGEWHDRTLTTEQYFKNATIKSDLYKQLIEKDYSIGLYTSEEVIGTEVLLGEVRNLEEGKPEVSSKRDVFNTMLRLTAFRYFPHVLKKYTNYTDVDFYKYKQEGSYKFEEDVFFYNKLNDEGISIGNYPKAFIYYHLRGIHAPYTYDERVVNVEDSTEDKQARGALEIVYEYIEQLKNVDAYDNSTIILLADHGYKGMGQNPLFLVKEINANHEFTINMSPVSYDDLQGTYLYWISGEKGNRTTIYDFEEGDDRTRYFNYYPVQDQRNEEVPFIEYAINGDARDMNSMIKTGFLYGKNGKYYNEKLKYEPGLLIDFGTEGNYENTIENGFRNFGGWIYSYEDATRFSIDMSNYQGGDLKIEVALANVLAPPQRLRLYVNDNYVDEMIANAAGDTLIYYVSEEYLNNGMTTFKIEYPDALVNGEGVVEGHTDSGLAVVFYSIKIDEHVQ